MSDSLQLHGLQHARLPCPLLSPGVCSNSRPLGGYSSFQWLRLLQSTGSRCTGFSSFSTQAQLLWCLGLVVPWHVESSWTRHRTCVPCIGRWILIQCATREVLKACLFTSGWGTSLTTLSRCCAHLCWDLNFVCLFLSHCPVSHPFLLPTAPGVSFPT